MHRTFVRALVITAILVTVTHVPVRAADKLRVAYVAPSVSLSLPWLAKESGILAKHDLAAEILLITGSPRLVQSLIAGDVDVVFAGVTALTRARGPVRMWRSLARRLISQARSCWLDVIRKYADSKR